MPLHPLPCCGEGLPRVLPSVVLLPKMVENTWQGPPGLPFHPQVPMPPLQDVAGVARAVAPHTGLPPLCAPLRLSPPCKARGRPASAQQGQSEPADARCPVLLQAEGGRDQRAQGTAVAGQADSPARGWLRSAVLAVKPPLPPTVTALRPPHWPRPQKPAETDPREGANPACGRQCREQNALRSAAHQHQQRIRKHQHKPTGKGRKVLAMNVLGTVEWFNIKNKYGFITRNDNKDEVFVHQTAIKRKKHGKYLHSLRHGEIVEFNITQGRKGPRAADVTGPGGVLVQGSKHAPDYIKTHRENSPAIFPDTPRTFQITALSHPTPIYPKSQPDPEANTGKLIRKGTQISG
ncbi:uncharacterized protein LOC102061417 isoform X5 [Zonotrichia albicollis]|uniref:uncharacterized protein LOC102061417 isoform X5 n=1 Tax=Zonotrichia albicollis TaxID=44394 RepID=UPI003D80E72C